MTEGRGLEDALEWDAARWDAAGRRLRGAAVPGHVGALLDTQELPHLPEPPQPPGVVPASPAAALVCASLSLHP